MTAWATDRNNIHNFTQKGNGIMMMRIKKTGSGCSFREAGYFFISNMVLLRYTPVMILM